MIRSKKTVLVVATFCLAVLVVAVAGAAGTTEPAGQDNNPRPQGLTDQKYTMSQTLSDQAQEATIAFDGLAFLTGQACSDTFLPPGKVADYAGFQYLRDNDPTQMGHNTDFVTRASDNVLSILDENQLAAFITLSKTEEPLAKQYGYMRFPLMKAFRSQLEGTIPAGSSGLDRAAVMAYSAELYDVDALISIERAKTYATVIRSLNQTQWQYLDRMASGGMLTWPVVNASAVLKVSGQDNSVAMRTYASEMFSWYAGSVEADTYFCPERQATYFGSFYMKDRPAMGNPDYSISTTLTGDSGKAFLDLLTDSQREKITSLVDIQRTDLNEIVTQRTAITTELRRALAGDTIDEDRVRSLSHRYGELDGEISYYYATHFGDVGKTITVEQKQEMMRLRNLGDFVCEGAYLYSQPVSMPQNIPSEFLFGVGSYDPSQVSAWIQGLQQPTLARTPGPLKPESAPGNLTPPDQRPVKPVQVQRNGSQPGTGPNQTQLLRMPAGDIIERLQQQGYEVSDVRALLQNKDHEAVKRWLDAFRMNHPGVIEAIESSWHTNRNGGNGVAERGSAQNASRLPAQSGLRSIIHTLSGWLSSL